MTPEQKGSIVFAINVLATALAKDDHEGVRLVQMQLDAIFPRSD